MRQFMKYFSVTLALACIALPNSPVRAQAPGGSGEATQTAELLAGLLGSGLLLDLFHSGSSSSSDTFSPSSTAPSGGSAFSSDGSGSGSAPSGSFSSGTSGLGSGSTNEGSAGPAAPVGVSSKLNAAPVPEASTSASLGMMLLLGSGGLALITRRRRSVNS